MDGEVILFYTSKNINIKEKDIHPSIIKSFFDNNSFNKSLKLATEKSKNRPVSNF